MEWRTAVSRYEFQKFQRRRRRRLGRRAHRIVVHDRSLVPLAVEGRKSRPVATLVYHPSRVACPKSARSRTSARQRRSDCRASGVNQEPYHAFLLACPEDAASRENRMVDHDEHRRSVWSVSRPPFSAFSYPIYVVSFAFALRVRSVATARNFYF
jgi:hypothetical protein